MNDLLHLFHPDREDRTSRLMAWLFLLLQLAGLALVIHLYRIEPSLHLSQLILVIIGAFILQPLVPRALRTWYFVLVSLAGLFLFTGLYNGLIVLGAGTLITLSAVYIRPARLKYAVLVLLFGGLVALVASGHPWAQSHFIALSTLGSMFMFRLSIFLYDKQHQKEKPSLIQDLSYFFMLPNMAILLYPAVDYKAFLSRQLNEKDLLIYKKGVQWLVLGIFHLVVYRAFYYYLLTPVSEVGDLHSFMRYAFTNYLLIIRLSGIFHTSVGILCLFGYNLPPVFNNYFLASGFSDLWRRINIYFREYLIKVFYYPVFFKFRHLGNTRGVVITILILFFLTWMLHSFQWFWLKGKFPLRMVDAIFWGLFGLLVAANAVLDMKKSRTVRQPTPWQKALRSSGQILGMFVFMSLLWSLWSANTLADWLAPVRLALNSPGIQYGTLILLLLGAWLLGTVLFRIFDRWKLGERINPEPYSAMASFWSLTMIGVLLLLQAPQSGAWLSRQTGLVLDGVLSAKLNRADEHLMVEGYYTEILIGNELTNPLGEMRTQRREQFRFTEGALVVDDFREVVQKPNTRFLFKDLPYSINEWGMRDKSYARQAPENTIRVLLLGGSFVVGSGIADDEVFDSILEERMNQSARDNRYEFLNASSSGFDLIDCIVRFDLDSLHAFGLDYAIYFSHGVDVQKNLKDIVLCYKKGCPIPYPFMDSLIGKAELHREMTEFEMMRRLEPYGMEMLISSYRLLYARCLAHGITPVWAYWPTVGLRPHMEQEKQDILPIVEAMGYRILDLEGIYKNYHPDDLYVAPNDRHPNALGHRLVADELYRLFNGPFPLEKKR
jgi:hypothetical protein